MRRIAHRAIVTLFCGAIATCAPLIQQPMQPLTSVMAPVGTPAAQSQQAKPPRLNMWTVGATPNPAASVPLPAAFVGCWQGTISDVDSYVRQKVAFGTFTWPTQSYRFCYRNNATDRSSSMELRQFVINGKGLDLTEFDNQVVWSDSSRNAYLRNHFGDTDSLWVLFVPLRYREDIYAEELVILENPNLLRMRGVELIKVNYQDFARATFHADFHRVSDSSQ